MTSTIEFEKKIARLKDERAAENKKIALLKRENNDLKKNLGERAIIINQSPAGIMLIQKDRIYEVNETFLEETGYTRDELIGRNYFDLIKPEYLKIIKKTHKIWDSGKVSRDRYDTCFVTASGAPVLFYIESRRIIFQGRVSYILNMTRLEKRKQKEKEKISESKAEAEKRMALGFKSQLTEYAEKVIDAVKNCRKGFSPEDQKLILCLDKLEKESNNAVSEARMLKVIATSEKEYEDPVIFDINKILEDAVTLLPGSADEAVDIRVNKYFRSSSSAKGNPDQFREAVLQLLLNSVKTVPNDVQIDLTTEENSDFAYIYIQDNREGVGEQAIDRLFDPYYIIKPGIEPGLGMGFTRAVINKHGGDIEVSGTEGQGTVYQITLPIVRKEKRKSKINRGKLKKSRILILQSDDMVRGLITYLLADKGCHLETADSGLECLAKLKRKKAEMVIVDVDDLVVDEATFLIRCKRINPELLFVSIREKIKEKRGDKKEELSPDLTIIKPIDINNAVMKVSNLLMVEDK